MYYGLGGLQIPWFDRANLFLRRIAANPSGRLAGCGTPGWVWNAWRGCGTAGGGWNFQGTKKKSWNLRR